MENNILVAEEIKRQLMLIARFSFAAMALNNEITDHMLGYFAGEYPPYFMFYTRKGFEPSTTESNNVQDIPAHRINLSEAIEYTNANPSTGYEFFNTVMTGAVIKIGDLLTKNSYFTKSPELEFFRHIRNGVAHNNLFSFTNKEPSRPAKFGDFEITKDLEGQQVLYTVDGSSFLDEGDLLDLFVEIERQLRSI